MVAMALILKLKKLIRLYVWNPHKVFLVKPRSLASEVPSCYCSWFISAGCSFHLVPNVISSFFCVLVSMASWSTIPLERPLIYLLMTLCPVKVGWLYKYLGYSLFIHSRRFWRRKRHWDNGWAHTRKHTWEKFMLDKFYSCWFLCYYQKHWKVIIL